MQIAIRNQTLLRLLGHKPSGKGPMMASLPARLWLRVIWNRIVGR